MLLWTQSLFFESQNNGSLIKERVRALEKSILFCYTLKHEIKRLAKTVDDWVSNPNYSVKYFPPFEICAQLTEESGEVCREVAHLHGHKKKKRRQTDRWVRRRDWRRIICIGLFGKLT